MATNESGAPRCYWCGKTLTSMDTLLGKPREMPWLCGRCCGRLLATGYFDQPKPRETIAQYIDTIKAQEDLRWTSRATSGPSRSSEQ